MSNRTSFEEFNKQRAAEFRLGIPVRNLGKFTDVEPQAPFAPTVNETGEARAHLPGGVVYVDEGANARFMAFDPLANGQVRRPLPDYGPPIRGLNDLDAKPSNPKDIVGIRKVPMSTVSAAVMAEMGVAMLEGAAKYGRHNYRAVGVRSSVYYDATMRHLMSWWEGEDIDADSGLSHITKAIVSLVVLRDAMIQSKVEDDRPPRSAEFFAALNVRTAAILDKYADRQPPHHYTLKDAL